MFGKSRGVGPSVRRRVTIGVACAVAGILLLALRLWNLQVIRGEQMATLSENNRIRLRRVPATRGRVVDRNGKVLIDSQASFDAVLVPEDARDLAVDRRDAGAVPPPERGRDPGASSTAPPGARRSRKCW